MKEIIVIGGGPAGLTAAINAKNNNTNVTIIERNNNLGKKILVTGNGRCNYFNEEFITTKYHSSTLDDFSILINEENKKNILNFFNYLGVIPRIKNGYYYPSSNQATSILNTLTIEVEKKGINVVSNTLVVDIIKEDKFIIKTDKEDYQADALIITPGGLASPKTGSDGSLYHIIKKLDHEIIKPLPCLVQLKSDYKYLKELNGVRSEVKISYKDYFYEGELQFTSYGLSGICSMQLSNYLVSSLDNNNETISIDYFPNIINIKDFLNEINNKTNDRTIGNILDQLLNYKIVNVLLKECNINYNSYIIDIDENSFNKLTTMLKNHNINIIGTNSFDDAQTTKGGVSLKDINLNTFESNKVKGLYFAGEVLDVNGDCGGYNLGFAWLSGIISGSSVGKND